MNYEQFVKLSLELRIGVENKAPFAFTQGFVEGTWVAAVIPEFQYEVFSTIAEDASNWVSDAMDYYNISEKEAERRIEANEFNCKITVAWLKHEDEEDLDEAFIEDLPNFETLLVDLTDDYNKFITEFLGVTECE